MTYLRERLGNTIEAEMYRRLREWWDNNKGAIVLPAPGSPITDRGFASWLPLPALLRLLGDDPEDLTDAKELCMAQVRMNTRLAARRDLPASHAIAAVAYTYDLHHANAAAAGL